MLLILACKITTIFLNKEEELKKYANKVLVLSNYQKNVPIFRTFFVPLQG